MFQSELLNEKYRVQMLLSKQSSSAHEYLVNARRAAEEIAKLRGFRLNYVELSNADIDQAIRAKLDWGKAV